jgi:hypothetical protein
MDRVKLPQCLFRLSTLTRIYFSLLPFSRQIKVGSLDHTVVCVCVCRLCICICLPLTTQDRLNLVS